ncbi:MAG: radical SAM protein [Thermoplasmatales archaeon]|nr:radical SAM protein [Thermoplasmatales archaeon]
MFSKKFVPRFALYELTLRCNMNCIHCGSSAGLKRTKELTTEEWNNVTKQLADLNCKEITLLGGEPFLRKDWYEISKEVKDRGIKITYMSNGFLINEKTIEKLRKIEPKTISVSIDGARKETHDKIRQLNGSFDKCMEVISNLKKAGLNTTVITSINKLNFQELPELISILLNKGIVWQLQIAIPLGRFKKDLLLSKEEYYAAAIFIASSRDKYSQKELPIIGTHCFGYYSKILRNPMVFPWNGCQAGISAIGIQSNGEVKGCLSLPPEFIEGNIRENTISEIWQKPGFCSYNRDFKKFDLNNDCVNCRFGEKCRGGCIGVSVGITGKSNGDTYCFKLIEENN